MKRIIPPPSPPQTVLKGPGCMVPFLIGAAILATAIGVWPSFARADTCTLPPVTSCTVMMCLKCADGGDGTQYCSSGGAYACNTCTPDPSLWSCVRPDGTTYSKPLFTPDARVILTPAVPGTPPGMDTRGKTFREGPGASRDGIVGPGKTLGQWEIPPYNDGLGATIMPHTSNPPPAISGGIATQ